MSVLFLGVFLTLLCVLHLIYSTCKLRYTKIKLLEMFYSEKRFASRRD